MYTVNDFNIPEERRNDANAWLHEAYNWDMEGEYDKAVFCMTRSVELGSVLACDYLAEYYAQGQGVAQDYIRAAELYARVAACEEYLVSEDYFPQSRAAYILGTYHEKGLLPDASPETAAEWYRKALEDADDASFVPPAIALAGMYLDGRGVEKSAAKAFNLVYGAIPRLLDGADKPALRALCLRLLECEEITVDEEDCLYLQQHADRLQGNVSPF